MQYYEAMHEIGQWSDALELKEFAPSPQWHGFIESYQLLRGPELKQPRQPWYILPDNTAHLIFYLLKKGRHTIPTLRLVGPRSAHRLISRTKRRLTFIATFQPGALWHFTQLPLMEFTDLALDASQLLKGVTDEWLEKMTQAAQQLEVDGMIHQMEKLLAENLNFCHTAAHFLVQFDHALREPLVQVKSIAHQMGISERHLRSLSRKYIGHSPKDILQISRFTQSLILSNAHREWPAIALDAGYFDQSHMIAAYQRMCGRSPEKLFNA